MVEDIDKKLENIYGISPYINLDRDDIYAGDEQGEWEEEDIYRREIVNSPYGIKDTNKLNEAQRILYKVYISRYGREQHKLQGLIETTNRILTRRFISFGSIEGYYIDSLPDTLFRIKGTEITYISSDYLEHAGKSIISRLFASKVLSFWAYIVDIKYEEAIKYWCNREPAILSYNTEIPYLIGEDILSMLKDILWITRRKNISKILRYIPKGDVSPQLYNLIRARQLSTKRTFHSIVMEMKDRLYYDEQFGEYAWSYPKITTEYLISLIDSLSSGRYFLGVPITIYRKIKKGGTFVFPIKCTDTHITKNDREFEKHIDDYEIGKYVFERY